MKFTDGVWMWRDGVRAMHPAAAGDVETGPGRLTVYAPTERVTDRDDLIDLPMLTVTCTAPMPGVIGVEITHFAGERPRGPWFELAGSEGGAEPRVDAGTAELTSGDLAVRIRRDGDWRVGFTANGRPLTASGPGAQALLTTGDGPYVREQLDLGVDDRVYGLGERFGPLVRNGQSVDIWNADGGTASEQAYKNVPFFVTNAGYGIFVDHPGRVSFEVASEHVSRVQFSVPGRSLRYFVIHGPTPKEILRRYTALTGRPALPPPWSFGLWLSTSFTTTYDEDTISGFVDGMAERGLPLSVFHFDCFWMRAQRWCDFEWDPEAFPDPRGMLKRLKARGLRVCLWINPYIAQRSPLFVEGRANGYLLTTPDGDVWQTDLWQPGTAVVDFTDPGARAWYAGKLDALLEMGADAFKTDFGERIPVGAVFHDGSDPERAHNHYAYLYQRTVFDLLRERRGDGEAVVFARAATTGCQQFPVHWGGDVASTFTGMAQNLRGGLSLGLSGFGFFSHDIGGFEGTPDPELFKRWVAFGMLSSHSRLHGRHSYRVPWLFDGESVEVLRRFTELKLALMPYLYGAARQAHDEGVPVMRAMVLEFPDDPACAYLDRQYMLGDDLLVAPVFRADGQVTYYVPDGTWTDVLTGDPVRGPGWRTGTYDALHLPLLARPGAVVPFGAAPDRPDYDYRAGVTLRVYAVPDGARVVTEIPAPDGGVAARFTTSRVGDAVTVTADGPEPYRVLLVGEAAPDVEGGTARPHEQGALIEAHSPSVVVRGYQGGRMP